MAEPIRTNLATVLLAIRDELVFRLNWPEERVLLLDPDEVELPLTQGDQFLCLWFDGESADGPIFEGAGRVDTREDVRLVVALYTRLAADERGSARAWLTGPALGHLAARHKILDALLCFQPEDEDENVLTFEPIHPAPLSKPHRDKKQTGWGESRLGFALGYLLDLDQSRQ